MIRWRDDWILLIAACISILLSAWIYWRETLINTDAICYLMSAQAFTESGLRAAMHQCGQAKWPFYSILISLISQVTHFSYTSSAYLLNGLFSIISVCFFLKVIKKLGGSTRILWIALAIILLAHQFNSVRQYIVRDHGFWAFYLISLFALLSYIENPKWLNAWLFSISLIIATLFRIEGLVFLASLPFILFFCNQYPPKNRLAYFFILNLPLLILTSLISVWLFFHPEQMEDRLGRVPEIGVQIQHGMSFMGEQYQRIKLGLLEHVLTADSARDVGLLIGLIIFLWYLINILGNLSWIYSLLFIYGLRVIHFKRYQYLVLWAYIIINLFVTFIFFSQHLFLSKRYLIALSLICMLWVPFALDKLFEQRSRAYYKLSLVMASFLIFISSLGGIIDFGYSKVYVRTAGDWIATHIPVQASLYANDPQLMYYSQRTDRKVLQTFYDMDIQHIARGQWKNYDYLAIRINKNTDSNVKSIVNQVALKPIKIFANKRGDQILVYKVLHF